MTTSTPTTITPGLAAVRARQADLAAEAKRIASMMSVDNATVQKWRDALRHIAGIRTFVPEQPAIDALLALGVVELCDPSAVYVCGRYRPTGLGVEVLGLLGRASR